MEKKSFSYKHPYIGGILSIVVYYLLIMVLTPVLGYIITLFAGKSLTFDMAGEIGGIITAILCLIIHRFRHRKEKYRGTLTFRRSATKDVWKCVLIVGLFDIVLNIPSWLTLEGGLRSVICPSAYALCMAVFAGMNEEIAFRAIPVSIMMRNKPGAVRIYGSVILTSLIFGLMHCLNFLAGSSGPYIILQVLTGFILGIFFAAIYIRSGSILVPIVFHTIHDILAFMDPRQATGVGTIERITTLDMVIMALSILMFGIATLYLLRRSVWKEEKQIWAKIWNEEQNEEQTRIQNDEMTEEQTEEQIEKLNS